MPRYLVWGLREAPQQEVLRPLACGWSRLVGVLHPAAGTRWGKVHDDLLPCICRRRSTQGEKPPSIRPPDMSSARAALRSPDVFLIVNRSSALTRGRLTVSDGSRAGSLDLLVALVMWCCWPEGARGHPIAIAITGLGRFKPATGAPPCKVNCTTAPPVVLILYTSALISSLCRDGIPHAVALSCRLRSLSLLVRLITPSARTLAYCTPAYRTAAGIKSRSPNLAQQAALSSHSFPGDGDGECALFARLSIPRADRRTVLQYITTLRSPLSTRPTIQASTPSHPSPWSRYRLTRW